MNDLDNLIERVKNKDEQAIRELYNLTYRKAYIIALSFMGEHDKVDDILQNAYISIFNHIDDLKDSSHLFSWVNTIVSNTCKSELRKNKSYSFSDIEDEEYMIESDIEEEHKEFIPDKNVNYEEDRKVVIGFINELPLEQRSALIMYIYEDMKISEIAKVFECSENTIKSRLNYAKKTLKEKIVEYKSKGNTLFSIPLIPYLRFILDETYIQPASNLHAVNIDNVSNTIEAASQEASKHNHILTTFISNYWAAVGALLATLISLNAFTPSPVDPVKLENIRLKMLEAYEVHYLNGTSFNEVMNGYNESQRLLKEYMALNDDKELDEYYASLLATTDMANVYRAYLADKQKPTHVQLTHANKDEITDLICYYEKEIANPHKYDIRDDGELIESKTLKVNYAKVLAVEGERGIIDAGDILKEYKYAYITQISYYDGHLYVDCRYGNTYDAFISSSMLLEYIIEDNQLRLIQSFDCYNSDPWQQDDYPYKLYEGFIRGTQKEKYEDYK